MKPIPVYTPESLEAIAASQGKPLAEIALDIHKVASHIDEFGNRSAATSALSDRALPTYFLTEDTGALIDGILFYNSEKHWRGWQVRKNPYWLDTWCQRYGKLPGCEQLAADWEAIKSRKAAEEAEAKKPKRTSETWVRGKWSDFDTLTLGKHWAFAYLTETAIVARFKDYAERLNRSQSMTGYLYEMWRDQHSAIDSELRYRMAVGDVEAARLCKLSVNEHLRLWYNAEHIRQAVDGTSPDNFQMADPLPIVPKVVHVKSSEWANCPDDEKVYIGRNMRGFKDQGWGNPHKLGGDEDKRLEVIELFRLELLQDANRLEKLSELRGKRLLGCWCKDAGRMYSHWREFDKACHGDVLVELLALPEDELEKLISRARGEE